MPDQTEIKPKHPGGRPLLFKTPEDLEAKIEGYFGPEGPEYKTWNGLAVWLDCSPMTIIRYEGDRPEFCEVLARARDKVRQFYEDLGCNPRSSHFPNSMLNRLGQPEMGAQGGLGQGNTLILVIDGGDAARSIESRVLDALPINPLPVVVEHEPAEIGPGDSAA